MANDQCNPDSFLKWNPQATPSLTWPARNLCPDAVLQFGPLVPRTLPRVIRVAQPRIQVWIWSLWPMNVLESDQSDHLLLTVVIIPLTRILRTCVITPTISLHIVNLLQLPNLLQPVNLRHLPNQTILPIHRQALLTLSEINENKNISTSPIPKVGNPRLAQPLRPQLRSRNNSQRRWFGNTRRSVGSPRS